MSDQSLQNEIALVVQDYSLETHLKCLELTEAILRMPQMQSIKSVLRSVYEEKPHWCEDLSDSVLDWIFDLQD